MASIDPFGSNENPEDWPLSENGGNSFNTDLPEFDFAETSEESLIPSASVANTPTTAPPILMANLAEQTTRSDEIHTDAEVQRRRQWRRLLFAAAPSWLISLLLHLILILALAMITLDPVSQVLSILQASGNVEESSIDEFKLEGPQAIEAPKAEEESVTLPESSVSLKMELSEVQQPTVATLQTSVSAMESDALASSILNRSLLSSSSTSMTTMLNSRSMAAKSELIEKFGGNAASEKSVALALKWFAAHQVKASGPKLGAWSFAHNIATRKPSTGQGEFAESTNAATALALLPFLGAGQTHLEGQYKETVKAGLAALIRAMELRTEDGMPCGSWHERRGNMYSHGLATIAICEAYAMTHDPDLLQPAQLAINYILVCQDPRGGGWRYGKQQAGDTSVVGWCVMGLKSGRMGNLSVPPSVFIRANNFLDLVSTDNGAFYGYTGPVADRNPTLTSVGLLCRMYLGWPKDHPGLQAGIKFLSETGPTTENLYYTYYATQIMRHHGGDVWDQWNRRLRDTLVSQQVTEGMDAGSWEPKGPHSREGGRLYQTALATMILEVYYRHLPLYSDKSLDDEFEI